MEGEKGLDLGGSGKASYQPTGASTISGVSEHQEGPIRSLLLGFSSKLSIYINLPVRLKQNNGKDRWYVGNYKQLGINN